MPKAREGKGREANGARVGLQPRVGGRRRPRVEGWRQPPLEKQASPSRGNHCCLFGVLCSRNAVLRSPRCSYCLSKDAHRSLSRLPQENQQRWQKTLSHSSPPRWQKNKPDQLYLLPPAVVWPSSYTCTARPLVRKRVTIHRRTRPIFVKPPFA